METNNSEHNKEEKPGSQKDEQRKERIIQESEGQIAKSKEQLNAVNDEISLLTEQLLQRQSELVESERAVGEPGSGHETEEKIEQLTRQFKEAIITINKLESDNQTLREGKYTAELAKAKLEEEKDKEIKRLKRIIYELKCELSHKKEKFRDAHKHLQQKGQLCNKDCVLCSLLWICNKKLGLKPCGSHLRTILTMEAKQKFGTIEDKYLRCDAFMHILLQCEVVQIYYPEYPPKMIDKYNRDVEIDEAWEKLMTANATKRAVMIGRKILKAHQVGHCVVCDLEAESMNDGRLTVHDPQSGEWGTVNQGAFRSCVKDDERLILYTVNFEKLKQIIEAHGDILHETNKDCKINPTDNNCIVTELSAESTVTESPEEPTITESPVEPKVAESPAKSTVTESPAKSTVTELSVEPKTTELSAEPSPVEQDIL